MGLRPAGAAGVRLRPFTPAAPAAAALPGRRGGGAEAPRRLLLFDWARPGAVSLGSGSVSLSSLLSAPHSRRLTAAAAAGGAWRFEGERRRGEGRGGGGGAAVAGGGAVCPGTERPRPWRTPISSSTSSSATQVRVPGSARRVSVACGPGPRGKRCRAAARAPTPPGASLPAAPLHFRSAGAGDVGTANGRGLAGPDPQPLPRAACSWRPRRPFATPGVGSV